MAFVVNARKLPLTHFPIAFGFHRINRWDEDDSLGRPGRRWATQLFVLEGQGSRCLEQIEAILNRDKKDATYKPALFRALNESTTTSHHTARPLPPAPSKGFANRCRHASTR
jgi:hypothetical protein